MASTALAIEGGAPAVSGHLYRRWPRFTFADYWATLKVLRAGCDDVGGPNSRFAREFEAAFAEFSGARFCRAVASGTDALWAALVAAGVEESDEVIVPVLTYVATADAVLFAGAEIVWCDIDPVTFNLDVSQVERLIGPRTKAIVPVHAHGLIADMGRLIAIAARHGIAIVEDAAPAAGVGQAGRMAGTFGIAGAGSLNVKKLLQAGDGGYVVTNDEDAFEAVVSATTFGIDQSPRPGRGETSAHWARSLGRNSRLHAVAAAIARAQLRCLPEYLATAERNAAILTAGLAAVPGVEPPHVPVWSRSTWHLYRVRLEPAAWGWEGSLHELRDRVMAALLAEGVEVGTWQLYPLPDMPVFRQGKPLLWTPGAAPPDLKPRDGTSFPEARRLLEISFVLGRTPYPLQVQTARLMHAIVRAFEKVAERRSAVLSRAYEPLRIAPPIAPAEL